MRKQGCAVGSKGIRLEVYPRREPQTPCFIAQSRIHKKLEKLRKSQAAGFADDFVGCQAVGEGIYLSGNEQAHRADSRKSAAKPTPFRKSNATA